MFWGYSLAYSRTAGPFIGDMANFGMINVRAAPSPGSPYILEIVFCLYQMLFCACTVEIVIGGSFERGRIVPSLVFGFFVRKLSRDANPGTQNSRFFRPRRGMLSLKISVGDDRLLSNRVLDLECEWLIVQSSISGLCGWRSRAHRLGLECSRIRICTWKAQA